MYLNDFDDEQLGAFGIGRKLKKAAKKVKKLVIKTNPLFRLQASVASRTRKPISMLINKRRKPVNNLGPAVLGPSTYETVAQQAVGAPSAAIPQYDYDGQEMTQEERSAMIDDAEPMLEPIASGYPSQEEVFEPDVPELVTGIPTDAPAPKKKSILPWVTGGILLLKILA